MNNLIAIRKSLGYSQKDLAAELGVQQTGVSYYESGRGDPSIGIARKLIEVAKMRGVHLTLDQIYAEPLPEQASV